MNDATMTKADLVEEVIKATQMPRKEAEVTVETIFESIIGALQKGDKLEIRGFGSFRTRPRKGRIGRNPKTGEQVQVPAKRIPFFKPSKELKDYVNGGNAEAAAAPSKFLSGLIFSHGISLDSLAIQVHRRRKKE